MISREDILAVKERSDISDVIARSGVTLKNSGINSMKGLCPFHDEKSGSFTVRPTHGTFRCFGCGESGDVISFVQKKEGLSFTESVRYVADMFGIEIKEEVEEEESGPSRKQLHELMRTAADYFRAQYEELPDAHPAKQELEKRQLSALAHESGVGYAPEGWSHTKEYLLKKGFSEEDLLTVGLISRSENGRTFDFFRGRLTWEIRDISSRVIGFGARRLFETDKGPKYLNTGETPIYHKSSVLYNLDVARAHAAKAGIMYVVEGYTDIMAFCAAGIYNVVASSGTAFGEQHAGVLRRVVGESGNIIFCFDGDTAGMKAARAVFALKTPIHSTAKAVVFSKGDPCDIRIQSGNSGLVKALEAETSLTEFVLRHELSRFDVVTSEGRSQYLNAVAPMLNSILDPSLRDDYTRKVTLWSGSTLSVVKNIVNKNSHRAAEPIPEDLGNPLDDRLVQKDSQVVERQKTLLALALQHPTGAYRAVGDMDFAFFDENLQGVAAEVLGLLKSDPTALENTRPDEFGDPQLVQALMDKQFPIIERSVSNGGSTTTAVERAFKKTVLNIKTLRMHEDASKLRASVASVLSQSADNDVSILGDIEKAQRKIRSGSR